MNKLNHSVCPFFFGTKNDIAWFVDYRKTELASRSTKVSDPSVRITICSPGEKIMRTTLGSGNYGMRAKTGYHKDVPHPEWDQEALKSKQRVFDSACSPNACKTFEVLDIDTQTLCEATASSWMQCINSNF